MEGYIKLHRSILESSIFASQLGMKIWIWSLLKANYSTKHIPIKIGKGETIVKVDRGSFIFGRFKAEEELNIDASTVYKWIKKFESEGMINVTSNNHYSIVTICKYDYYQGDDTELVEDITTNQQPINNQSTTIQQPSNSHPTAIQQPRSTTKKNKNKEEEEEFNFSKSLISLGVEKSIIKDWFIVRKNKKLSNTEIAFNSIKNQIELSGLSANQCIKMAVEKSWGGFNASWLKQKPQQDTTEKKPTDLCMVSVLNEQTGSWNSERLTIRAYEMNLRMYPNGTRFIKYIDNE